MQYVASHHEPHTKENMIPFWHACSLSSEVGDVRPHTALGVITVVDVDFPVWCRAKLRVYLGMASDKYKKTAGRCGL